MKRLELLEKSKEKMTANHLSASTIEAYLSVINQFFTWLLNTPSALKMNYSERMEAYLTWRVREKHISRSTQNVDFNALLFLGRHILREKIEKIDALRAGKTNRIPHILNENQINLLFRTMPSEYLLISKLLYGVGLRINECLRLRIKDVDLSLNKILIREGKGDKDGIVPIPKSLLPEIESQIEKSLAQWKKDRAKKLNGVYIPNALAVKYKSASISKDWYWLFPNPTISVDPESGMLRRHHIYDFAVQAAFVTARRKAGLPEYATPHTLRHCYATHFVQSLLRQGVPERMAEEKLVEYLRHSSRDTLKWYLHLAMPENVLIESPLDRMSSGIEE